MATLYFALGTNLGDRHANLRRALAGLRQTLAIDCISPIYETEPAYVRDQPRFYNLAARAATHLSPPQVLNVFKDLEVALGREPGIRFGPRLIDIDLLFYDALVIDSHALVVPHPRLHERAFVLAPLADIAPDLIHPALNLTVAQLLADLSDSERREVRQLHP